MAQRIRTCTAIIEQENVARRRELAEAACGSGDGIGFHDLSIGELRNLSAAARRLSRRRAALGLFGRADALSGLGEDRLVENLNAIATPVRRRDWEIAAIWSESVAMSCATIFFRTHWTSAVGRE